jgi:hypothetical protein
MNSVNMNAHSVLTKELEKINWEISRLQAIIDDSDDYSDTRIAQDNIWDLIQVRAYVEGRVSELS